jgi:hypothetical protein
MISYRLSAPKRRIFMRIIVTVTDACVFETTVRPRSRWQVVAVIFLVLSVVSFVSGFIFGRPFITQSEVPENYLAEQKGDRFYAVKRRGGENPPSFEINEKSYRLWKQGETIHGLFHFGACSCFLVAWIIFSATRKKARVR